MIPLLFVILVTVATVVLGIVATKRAQSASDFFVAGRQVSVGMNASAISGEYLSAASFMGVAGLILKNGYDALWYPVGYAAGYLLLLLFIAGPLRRFGAYTIPDFAEGRFDSPLFRKIAVSFVLFIGFFYTMPQMKGAGVTMGTIMNWPYWVGIVVVGSVITFNVALGGMKGITFVQAFQYWVKLFAISVPVFVLMAVYGGYNAKLSASTLEPKGIPKVTKDTTLKFVGKDKAPANAVSFSAASETTITFTKETEIDKISTARKPEAGEDKLDASLAVLPKVEGPIPAGTTVTILPLIVTKGGVPVLKDGKPVKTAPKLEFAKPTEAVLAAGSFVPNTQNNAKWGLPFGTLTSKHGFPLLYTYSLIIALICGTAGLPHILVRFYTNPDGRSAKATTFWVMVLIGAFYFFTPIWGALGRTDLPSLYANNKTDAVVIALPKAIGGVWGDILSGITSAGAFAAFMSTFSGLLVSMSGALAHDIYGKILKPKATPDERIKMFKIAAVIFGVIAMGLGLLVETFDIAMLVGWAFAIAAASYFPLLLLGAWWRGLTMPGAAAGMLGGGLCSLFAIIAFMLSDKKIITIDDPLVKSLCEQPAIWGVPLSMLLMFFVSKATASQIPADADVKMLRLHAPEELGHSRDYIEDSAGAH
ncbi:cation acetate symporter [Armatimonas rosea]|uniref:Na+(H+)/acetate symporter ActP n=1 Tax=Armatimonas rosea TaxID=685828 RepID=A0A7W9SV63_ARMRO|nr:cation acetate symporter [Armatimonas rosea]MBB6053457.1 Na+(H+)/acetate symporter ActP [Armatimonas rosea]